MRIRFSTVEVVQYNGGTISTVGDSFSTVEGIQYIGGIPSVYTGGITSVLWRVFSTVGEDFWLFKTTKKYQYFFCTTKRTFYLEVSKILADFMPF